jgi:hypothetical protein
MFKLMQSDSYFWPVKIDVPSDGGKHDVQTFDVQLKRVSQSRLLEMKTEVLANTMTDASFAREVVIGWKGITDADGNDVPFSVDTLEKLLDIVTVAGSIAKAAMASYDGGAKRKN